MQIQRRVALTLALAAVAAAGCGGSGSGMKSVAENQPKNPETAAASSTGVSAGPATGTAGAVARLRSELNSALREHVSVATAAVEAALGDQGTAGQAYDTASAASRQNAVRVAQLFEGVYGQSAGSRLFTIWGPHVGYFVDYALGKKKNDSSTLNRASSGLRLYETQTADLLVRLNPKLERTTVEKALREHVDEVEAIVDARLSHTGNVKSLTRKAQAHMATMADIIASAIADQFPQGVPN